ncbi:ABC transporter substrate-binding protein [Phytohabitans sp. ZYX-F-186]|uniref:ABC transporter substrate-binding protein n=1 Tax=Phytohabitans maris TaxID=3071409 RepID=A0ABU0ZC27_9ACTN|nr:ABC transporter substrate-binding protein [Phytohabitans sp. ZYX-F-186]MDQ7904620.1 ABC transporter substrate-binding protein [Phytohabitans sp. ZYX-F-186]
MRSFRATFTPYPHTRALADGVVGLASGRLEFVRTEPIIKAYREMVRHLAFDIAELAPTTYLMARAAGIPIVAIPVFTKRQFHHGAILCHPSSGIRVPQDLLGRKVGVRAYSVTTGVWVRGLLSDDFDVQPDRIEWITDDEEHVPGYAAPPNVRPAPAGESLQGMLRAGQIDAALTGNAGVGRTGAPREGWKAAAAADEPSYSLFGTPEPLERDWYRRTGVYPIHAVITLREDLTKEHPDLPTELYQAFAAAKREGGADRATLIGQKTAAAAIPEREDPIPYGIEPNAASLTALVRYATEQRLLDVPPSLDSIFAPGDYPTA